MSNELSWNEVKKLKTRIHRNYIYRCLFGKKRLVMYYYKKEHGYKYDINAPKTFTEKINTRKLEKNPLYNIVADKIKVRDYVKEKIGKKYLIPLYFIAPKLTEKCYEEMPSQCVLKTASGSSTIKIIWDKEKENKSEILSLVKEYQKIDYAYVWGEMFYKNRKNFILCEKLLLDEKGKVPEDYKIHCFKNNGNPKFFIQIETDRFGTHKRSFYDEKWNRINLNTGLEQSEKDIPKPKKLNEILCIAKKLSEDFDYIRVDLYLLADEIYFGELTLTHNAGFSHFKPESYNVLWGKLWK